MSLDIGEGEVRLNTEQDVLDLVVVAGLRAGTASPSG
jgi:hypothetical protein